jgi:murein L,D-transpeptidase YafK
MGEDAANILIRKSRRTLTLSAGGSPLLTYGVVLGRNAEADKEIEGDHATPLGDFFVCAKNPRSKFFLSLCLSYPNIEDAERGLATGLIDAAEHDRIVAAIRAGRMPPQHTKLGGEIYIHGGRGRHGGPDERDWTRGCIAIDDDAMQELYDRVSVGTPVTIVE